MLEPAIAEYDAVSVVLLGSFNPRIFQPSWFVAQGLLAPEMAQDAAVELINNDFCAFETSWCRIEVLSDRWMIRSLSAPIMEPLRDLVEGTFKILSHTPVRAIGINSHGHFAMTENQYFAIGHALAPKEKFWSPIMEQPETLGVVVQGSRPDKNEGRVVVRVEPSTAVSYGIYIDINDEFRAPEDAEGTLFCLKVLLNEWDATRQRSSDIRDHILREGSGLDG
jgi:hypothetical protein